MEKQIAIFLNPFSFTQDVFLVEGEEKEKIGTCRITDPGFNEQMLAFGADKGVNHYHLFGAPIFVDGLTKRIKNDDGIATYSLEGNNEIIVEVN